jgi:hypothetical protein
MKWKDIFEDPDMVGQTEYLAIHDAIASSVLETDDPHPDRTLTEDELQRVQAMLAEFRLVMSRLGGHGKKVVALPAETVDWQLLSKQKAVLVETMMNTKTSRPVREALEGIVGFLDDIQDRAEAILGKEALGTK